MEDGRAAGSGVTDGAVLLRPFEMSDVWASAQPRVHTRSLRPCSWWIIEEDHAEAVPCGPHSRTLLLTEGIAEIRMISSFTRLRMCPSKGASGIGSSTVSVHTGRCRALSNRRAGRIGGGHRALRPQGRPDHVVRLAALDDRGLSLIVQ